MVIKLPNLRGLFKAKERITAIIPAVDPSRPRVCSICGKPLKYTVTRGQQGYHPMTGERISPWMRESVSCPLRSYYRHDHWDKDSEGQWVKSS